MSCLPLALDRRERQMLERSAGIPEAAYRDQRWCGSPGGAIRERVVAWWYENGLSP